MRPLSAPLLQHNWVHPQSRTLQALAATLRLQSRTPHLSGKGTATRTTCAAVTRSKVRATTHALAA